MFEMFKKHRLLKLSLTLLIFVLAYFLISPFIEVFKGVSIPLSSLKGEYKGANSETYLLIESDKLGKVVTEKISDGFYFTYESGTLMCLGIETDLNFEIKILKSKNLYLDLTNEYLKRNDNNEN